MGVRVTVSGEEVYPESYSVSESSMPIAGGDSSGAVGTIELQVSDLPAIPSSMNLEETVTLLDSNRGSTSGKIRQVGAGLDRGVKYSVLADNLLGRFNIEVQTQPQATNFQTAFLYYCNLAGIAPSSVNIDSAVANRTVRFPGWYGNLWNNMKEMATGMGVDLNLISNIVTVRPIRKFEAIRNREFESSVSADGTSLALKQEVIWYQSVYVASGLIYPPGGWNSEVRVLSVNAGETVETTLETNSSIFSIDQPVASTSVAKDYTASSVYTVVGDDGLPIVPAQWADYGGRLSVSITPDTLSLVVKITGATGLVQANGNPIRTYRIGISSGTSADDTYSTLRIVGRHIRLDKRSTILPTGVTPERTNQEFAPTIDSFFLNNTNDAFSAGTRGARRHAGRSLSYSASVSALNRRGETGSEAAAPYSYFRALYAGQTYGARKTAFAGQNYSYVRSLAQATVQDSFDNQIFGNAPGARVWDQESGRWYRVRQATTTWSEISIEAEDDMTNGDMKVKFTGMTYGQAKTHYGSNNYYKANLRGAA